MEALVALGVAGNVVQFVDFLRKLLSEGSEIAGSIDGATEQITELEDIYDRLNTFNSTLHRGGIFSNHTSGSSWGHIALLDKSYDASRGANIQPHIKALEELATNCNVLCGKMLEIVRSLRFKSSSGHPFKSFIAALKTAWSSKKIKVLEESLDRYQKMISLHFLPLLVYQQDYMLRKVDMLRDECMRSMLDQGSKLDGVAKKLQDLPGLLQLHPESISNAQDAAPSVSKTLRPQVANTPCLQNKSDLREDYFEGLLGAFENLTIAERDLVLLTRQQAFLRTLNYPSRPFRHNDISTAHNKTFQWILNPTRDKKDMKSSDQSSFLLRWLKYGNGTFWVSGKAGSGKSTLMKFVVDSHTTRTSLESWAGSNRLVIACHYFWASGTPMQKSQQGLLRSLLYDICCACPEIISSVFPHEWATVTNLKDYTHEWSNRELLDALQRLGQLPESQVLVKYCMFIDGVDEFDGDHFELCQVLKGLSMSPNVKCCLSSRPWNVFEDAFGGDQSQKIYLQDLTRRDILNYAHSRLSEHPRWNKRSFPADQMKSIVDEITQRAQGVFLWAFLVTRSLRDGLVNGDTISELQQRLNSLPSDLENLFKHMLEKVDSHYHRKMGRVFRIALVAKKPLPLHFYRVRDYEETDEDYALNKSTELQKPQLLHGAVEQYRRRINAQSGGLLEISKDSTVQFLHRTVRDFLFTREMNDYLCEKSGGNFMVNISVLKAFVFLFRCWWHNAIWLIPSIEPFNPAIEAIFDEEVLFSKNHSSRDKVFWQECLQYANDSFLESSETALTYLDYIADLYSLEQPSLYALGFGRSRITNGLCVIDQYYFTIAVLKAGVDEYFLAKLKETPDFFLDKRTMRCIPIEHCINQSPWTEGHVNILTRYLDWNHEKEVENGWRSLIKQTCTLNHAEADNNFRNAIEHSFFLRLLKSGASRTTLITDSVTREDLTYMAFIGRPKETRRYPFTMFIKALLYYQGAFNQKFSNACLGVVEEFIATSPQEIILQVEEIVRLARAYRRLQKFTAQNSVLHPEKNSSQENKEWFWVHEAEKVKIRSRESFIGRLRALAPIAQILITKTIELKMQLEMVMEWLEELVPAILEFFPGILGENLAGLIRSEDKGCELLTSSN
ncbi:hypothetical protein NHQ30_004178 [Ciborinia camelliae]|nr:hypothetical protein NHQ30_004178 [Ciborinia camelliae]